MQTKLTQTELEYLASASFIPGELSKILKGALPFTPGSNVLEISEEQADTLRDALGQQLQMVGFDEDYKPTSIGLILEALIDKFYAG